MSSYDIDAALDDSNTSDAYKQRIRRQVDDYCLGINRAWTPDPGTEWDPQFLIDHLKGINNPKAETKGPGSTRDLGVRFLSKNEQQLDPLKQGYSRIMTAPSDKAAMDILKRIGYGSIWPHLPAKPGVPYDQLTDAERVGIVDKSSYRKVMQPMSRFIFEKYISFRGMMEHYDQIISQHVRQMSHPGLLANINESQNETENNEAEAEPAESGPQDTEMASTPEEVQQQSETQAPSEEEQGSNSDVPRDSDIDYSFQDVAKLRSILSQCWTDAAKEIREMFHLEGGRMDISPEDVPLVHHADAQWIFRHMKTSKLHESHGYLVPWIDLDPSCRGSEERMKQYYDATRQIRGTCLTPDLNLQDLGLSNNLLALLYGRSEGTPQMMFIDDYNSTHIGRSSRILNGLFAKGITVRVDRSEDMTINWMTAENYIQCWDAFPNMGPVHTNNGKLWNAGVKDNYSDQYGVWDMNETYASGEAQVTLLSQCLTYSFLDKVCLAILEDRLGDFKKAKPFESRESILLSRLPDKYDDYRVMDFYENPQRFTCYEGIKVQIVWFFTDTLLHGWQTIVGNKVRQDFINAGNLWNQIQAEVDHHYGNLQPAPGVQGLPHFQENASRSHRFDLYYDILGKVVRRGLIESTVWKEMRNLSYERRRKDLDFGIKQAYRITLLGWSRELFLYYLRELVHRGAFVSSPSFRKYFQCTTQAEDLLDNNYRLKKTVMNFPRIEAQRTGEAVESKQEKLTIRLVYEMLGNPVSVSVLSMRKLVDTMIVAFNHRQSVSDLVRDITRKMQGMVYLATYMDTTGRYCLDSDWIDTLSKSEGSDKYGPGPGLSNLRRKWNWESRLRQCAQGTMLSLEHLDNFIYEEWEKVPAKRYHRLYSWIDEKRGLIKEVHTAEEATVELRKFIDSIITAIGSKSMTNIAANNMSIYSDPSDQEDRQDEPDELPLLTDEANENIRDAMLPPGYDASSPTEAEDYWKVKIPGPPQAPPAQGLSQTEKRRRKRQKGRAEAAANRISDVMEKMEKTSLQAGPVAQSGEERTVQIASSSDVAHTQSRDDDGDVEMTSEDGQNNFDIEAERDVQRRIANARAGDLVRTDSNTFRLIGSGFVRARTPEEERQKRRQKRIEQLENSRQRHSPSTQAQTPGAAAQDNRKPMMKQHWDTLDVIFRRNIQGRMTFRDLTDLLTQFGYKVTQSSGSRVMASWTTACPWSVSFQPNGLSNDSVKFHDPHHSRHVDPPNVQHYRKELEAVGIDMNLIERHFKQR